MKTLADWLREAPFTLTMSSGFFGFFAHTGVLQVLQEEGLTPARVSGSSAGALVTGAFAAGLDAEDLMRELLKLERAHFWDPRPGFGLLRGKLFREKLHMLLPTQRIERTRMPIAISVYDVLARSTTVLTRGDLAQAIHASCAVPFMFHPVWIDGRPHADGGVADRPGLQGVASNERVLYHHLSSRSPWRSSRDPQLAVPARNNMHALVFDSLPRVGPFKLHVGREAYEEAKRRTREALLSEVR